MKNKKNIRHILDSIRPENIIIDEKKDYEILSDCPEIRDKLIESIMYSIKPEGIIINEAEEQKLLKELEKITSQYTEH